MKTELFKKLVLFTYFFITFAINLISKDDFEVLELNNPAPGYIKLDRIPYLFDNYGKPVFEDKITLSKDFFKLLENGLWANLDNSKYYLYDKNLKIIDSISNPTNYTLDPHDIISLTNGNYLLLCTEVIIMDLSRVVEGGNPNANIISNVLIEVDTDGNLYWQWRAIDHTEIMEIVDDLPLSHYSIDFTHINSMYEDSNGNILVSIRHFDEVALINKETGDFIWRLGGSKSKKNQFNFINDTIDGYFGFSHQHTASILPNGNILIYDNGNLKPNQYSRAVEYKLDFTSKTATKVWEYRHSPDIYNGSMGSAFRLENGNTLINFSNGRVVEVKPDQSKAFEIINLQNAEFCYLAQKTTMYAVYSKNYISTPGNYTFYNNPNNTGVRLDLHDVRGSSNTYIQRHSYAPPTAEYADSIFTEILHVRWVITSDNKLSISGTINIDVSTIENLSNPENLIIFQRDAEAFGIFQKLQTTFNSSTGEISANFSGLGEFTIGSTGLIKPNLIEPINNSKQEISGLMIWKKLEGAFRYRLQISDDNDFLKVFKDTIIEYSTVYKYHNLLNDKSYFWRVKALNLIDSSQWSDIGNFTTFIPKNKIVLKQPSNEGFVVNIDCNFEWNKIDDADFYLLEISHSASFDDMFHQETNINVESIKLSGLKPNSIYFWRVCYFKNNVVSDWSDIWSFYTSSHTILETPVLSLPEDNSFSAGINGELIWQESQGAKLYHVSISERSDFSTIILSQTDINETKFNYSDLEYDKKYYWRVAAYNDNDWNYIGEIIYNNTDLNNDSKSSVSEATNNYKERSKWSESRTFYTELEAPKINIQLNNFDNMPVNGFISWDIKNDCYSYNIQISKDIDFSDLVVDSMKILDKKFIYDLEPNTIYYCRVKTYNDNNKSQWSDVVKFKTESTTSVIINDDNKELEIFPNPVIDILNIQSNYFDNTDAVIYDLMGNIVLSTKFNYQINKIDVSNLNRGVYIILINNQKGLFIKQ